MRISSGAWYNHGRGEIDVSHLRVSVIRGYEVMYTAVPARGKLARPPPKRSRISPPLPVAAPLKGSTVVGKLCVSALRDSTVSISRSTKYEGTSGFSGENCLIDGPSMKATLSLYAETRRRGLRALVRFMSLKSEVSFSTPSIINVPLKILCLQCSEFT